MCSRYLLVFISLTSHMAASWWLQSMTPNPPVKLYGGNATYGVVQIYVADRWSTICDAYWDQEDASVVCRELGFDSGIQVRRAPEKFTKLHADQVLEQLSISLNHFECEGSESSILDCVHDEDTDTCGHDNDAGVICRHDVVTTDTMTTLPTEVIPETTTTMMTTQAPKIVTDVPVEQQVPAMEGSDLDIEDKRDILAPIIVHPSANVPPTPPTPAYTQSPDLDKPAESSPRISSGGRQILANATFILILLVVICG